jgi:hypothetical protein
MQQCIGSLQTSRKLLIQLGGRSYTYNSLNEFSIPDDTGKLINMCLNETYDIGR